MSYRTTVNGVQIFGNNDYPEVWIDFVKSQGIEVDENQCYEGDITDFMGALVTLEEYVIQLNKRREELSEKFNGLIGKNKIENLLDFSNRFEKIANQDPEDKYGYCLFDELMLIIDETYAFIPYVFFKACEDDLVREHIYTTAKHFHCYKLKDGAKIHVKAS